MKWTTLRCYKCGRFCIPVKIVEQRCWGSQDVNPPEPNYFCSSCSQTLDIDE